MKNHCMVSIANTVWSVATVLQELKEKDLMIGGKVAVDDGRERLVHH